MCLNCTCQNKNKPLETVSEVDLQRYAGKWYEIATIPKRFQRGCSCSQAEYILTDKNYIKVINSCIKGKEKNLSTIEGKAFITPNSGNAKLKVQFFWPFKGKYWIIELDSAYTYAVIGHPNRNYLWILSRTKNMDDKLYSELITKIKEKGYNINRIVRTEKECK